jgi:enoyl-CoA hydratase
VPLVHIAPLDGVTTITIDSPGNRNALSGALIAELRAGLERHIALESTHVVVLTATGTTFCAGADLTEIRDSGAWPSAGALGELLRLLAEADKPLLARVNGHVRGGGLGIVGACDIAVAAADATFAFPEVQLGVAPALIAPAVVPRLHPRAASRYLLTGEKFDAVEAARIGLLTEAVDDLDAVDRLVADLVTALRRGAPAAQAATKQVLRDVGWPVPTDALAPMRALSEDLFASPEAQRRIAAALDR